MSTIADPWGTALAVLISLGGGGVIVVMLSSWVTGNPSDAGWKDWQRLLME